MSRSSSSIRRALRATVLTALALAPLALTAAGRSASHASLVKLPDWSGAWIIPEGVFVDSLVHERQPGDPRSPLLSPSYAAVLRAEGIRFATGRDVDPKRPARTNSERCLPPGMPDVMRYPVAIEFLFTPGRVTLIGEEGPLVRRIYTDRRAHAQDADPSYNGESVGHWEGATLVVDTSAISTKATLLGAARSSGRAHVTERIHLQDPKHLQIDTVVEDPIALTAPWRYTRIYERIDPKFVEYVCLDNDRDKNGGEPDLTPASAVE